MVLSLLVTACNGPVARSPDILTGQLGSASDCRVVQHELGASCVPIQPQRVITLEISWILDPLLALGIKPVGTVSTYTGTREYFPGLSTDEVAGIEIIGTPTGISLEKILQLKPDLILSLDSGKQIYEHLSAIAPTVVEEYEKIKFSFKDNLRSIAQLVSREEKAEEILSQYQKQTEMIQKTLGERLKEPEISVINYLGGNFLLPASYAPFFQVLNDLDVRLKPIFLKQSEYIPFSLEIINKYDADILFIVDFDSKSTKFFLQNPLISSLKAAKTGRAYVVQADTWWSYGPLGINKLLNELPSYFLQDTLK